MDLKVRKTDHPQHKPQFNETDSAGQDSLIKTTRTPNPSTHPFVLGLVLGGIVMLLATIGLTAGYRSLITTCKTPTSYTSVVNKTAKDSIGNDLFISRGYYSSGNGVPGSNIALLFSFCGSVDPSLKPVSDMKVNLDGVEVVLAKAVIGGNTDGQESSSPLTMAP